MRQEDGVCQVGTYEVAQGAFTTRETYLPEIVIYSVWAGFLQESQFCVTFSRTAVAIKM